VWIETLPDQRRRATLAAAPVTADTLAEIVFTSGTTGEPKGAMLSHGNLMASATAMTAGAAVRRAGPAAVGPALSHLYEQVLGFMGPLIVGASIVYPSAASRGPDPHVPRLQVSVLLIVPQGLRCSNAAIERKVDQRAARARVRAGCTARARGPALAPPALFRPVLGEFGGRLHTIGVGASALDLEVAQRWTEMGVQILQGYGATEMGPPSSASPARSGLSSGPVGEPIPRA
jgi:long-chain acyl-CoA synthetase